MENKDLKIELVNELAFLLGLQEKLWKYHPNNPNARSIVDEYDQLQNDINVIQEELTNQI